MNNQASRSKKRLYLKGTRPLRGINIKDILFWIFLALSMILLIWNVFGNSPTEFVTIVVILFTILLKVTSISERVTKIEMRFNHLARDFKKHIKQK